MSLLGVVRTNFFKNKYHRACSFAFYLRKVCTNATRNFQPHRSPRHFSHNLSMQIASNVRYRTDLCQLDPRRLKTQPRLVTRSDERKGVTTHSICA